MLCALVKQDDDRLRRPTSLSEKLAFASNLAYKLRDSRGFHQRTDRFLQLIKCLKQDVTRNGGRSIRMTCFACAFRSGYITQQIEYQIVEALKNNWGLHVSPEQCTNSGEAWHKGYEVSWTMDNEAAHSRREQQMSNFSPGEAEPEGKEQQESSGAPLSPESNTATDLVAFAYSMFRSAAARGESVFVLPCFRCFFCEIVHGEEIDECVLKLKTWGFEIRTCICAKGHSFPDIVRW